MQSTHYLQLARSGDPRAKKYLIESLRPRVAKMAAYYARQCGEDADDLLQEAWVGLLEALPQLDLHIGSPEQYLIKCARWKLLDAIKRARVRRCLPLEDDGADTLPSPGSRAEETACVSEFAGDLKPTQQAVLRCLLAGMTWRETGSVLGCTSANVAYYVRQIRRKYQEWYEEPACTI